jgi:hypothetical protein
MSGDIGIGATRAAVKLSEKVLAARLPGYVQLAGGTNSHTVAKLKAIGLLKDWGRGTGDSEQRGNGDTNTRGHEDALKLPKKTSTSPRLHLPVSSSLSPIPNPQPYVAGVAYGSYARVLLSPILDELEKIHGEAVDANLPPNQSPSLGHLEQFPPLLWQAVAIAHSLVSQLKSSPNLLPAIPN